MELNLKNFEIRFADGFFKKLLGFMFFEKANFILIFDLKKEKKEIIHTFFCKPIYLYFLNEKKEVVEKTYLKSFRIYIPKNKFRYLIESFKDLKLKEKDKVVFDN